MIFSTDLVLQQTKFLFDQRLLGLISVVNHRLKNVYVFRCSLVDLKLKSKPFIQNHVSIRPHKQYYAAIQ